MEDVIVWGAILGVLIWIGLALVVMLVVRAFWLWYFRINHLVDSVRGTEAHVLRMARSIDHELGRISRALERLAASTDRPADPTTATPSPEVGAAPSPGPPPTPEPTAEQVAESNPMPSFRPPAMPPMADLARTWGESLGTEPSGSREGPQVAKLAYGVFLVVLLILGIWFLFWLLTAGSGGRGLSIPSMLILFVVIGSLWFMLASLARRESRS